MGLQVVSGTPRDDDRQIEATLRPRTMGEYLGQTQVKENLQVFVQAARGRQETLDHVLLYGPPGLGKTTLAHIIAGELGVAMKATSGPAIERPIDLLVILKSLQPHDVLFIDEIHRLSKIVEEILYPAMEDFRFDRVINRGLASRTAQIPLPPFTLVGATTRSGQISSPLRDRFGIVFHLQFYDHPQLEAIVIRASQILGIPVEPEGAAEIARRSRGTPRIANRLLRRVRDFAEVDGGGGVVTQVLANEALNRLGIDDAGLDGMDRRILTCILDTFKGGPVGLDTLAAAIHEDAANVEEVYEPFLVQEGFLQRTPRGRMAGPRAYEHLGFAPPANQPSLF